MKGWWFWEDWREKNRTKVAAVYWRLRQKGKEAHGGARTRNVQIFLLRSKVDPTVERKSLALFRLSYTGFWDGLLLGFCKQNARTALAVDLWPNNGSKNTHPLITDARFSLMRSMALCSAAFRRCARCDSHGTLVLHIPPCQNSLCEQSETSSKHSDRIGCLWKLWVCEKEKRNLEGGG